MSWLDDLRTEKLNAMRRAEEERRKATAANTQQLQRALRAARAIDAMVTRNLEDLAAATAETNTFWADDPNADHPNRVYSTINDEEKRIDYYNGQPYLLTQVTQVSWYIMRSKKFVWEKYMVSLLLDDEGNPTRFRISAFDLAGSNTRLLSKEWCMDSVDATEPSLREILMEYYRRGPNRYRHQPFEEP